ncbi:MAG: heparan-alpha-glucosaminide N-acetyltransferase domain-containing protein [Bacteroidota bacterium]
MRNPTADILKGLAVVFMIQVHIMEQFATAELYNSWIGQLSLFIGGPLCAPIFMGVMGYFMVSPKHNYWYFIKRGTSLFGIGIGLNIIRSLNLFASSYNHLIDINHLFYIFGIDILQLAGLSLFIFGLLQKAFKSKVLLYFTLAIILVIIEPIISSFAPINESSAYLFAIIGGTYEWSYFPILPWFSYILLGYCFRLLIEKNNLPKEIYSKTFFLFSIPIIIGLIITMPYASSIAHNLYGKGGYYHHGILFFVWELLFAAIYIYYLNYIIIRYFKTIKGIQWIGENVTIIYIVQWIIIGNLATILFLSQNAIQWLIWTIAIILASVLITWGILKIPKKKESLNY